jgi:hypothetical protein
MWLPAGVMRRSDSEIHVAYGRQKETRTDVRPGTIEEIWLPHASTKDKPELLSIMSTGFILPNGRDKRSRGVLVQQAWLTEESQNAVEETPALRLVVNAG